MAGAAHFLDADTLLFTAAHAIVLHRRASRTQQLIAGSPEAEALTALAVSPSKKFVAVAERADKALVTVYDLSTLKRRKVLVSAEVASKVSGPCSMMSPSVGCKTCMACAVVLALYVS